MKMTRNAYQVASTRLGDAPTRWLIERHAISRLAATRIAASASADRCSAFPWPYWCPTSAGRPATPSAKNVSSAAIRSVPECAASETRPRLFDASPATSLSATSAAAAKTERSAVRRCAVTRLVKQKSPPKRAPLFDSDEIRLRRRDVPAEDLFQHRPRALAAVLPVVEPQRLCGRRVVVVELAIATVGVTRERGAAAEERRDEVGREARRGASRVRVERAARDGPRQVADALARYACADGRPMVLVGRARARARSAKGRERSPVAARHAERAVAVVVHDVRPRERVARPRCAVTAVVLGHEREREPVVALLLALPLALVARIRKAGGRENERRQQHAGQDDEALHSVDPSHVVVSAEQIPWEEASCAVPTSGFGRLPPLERPDHDVLPPREVKQRLTLERNRVGRHRVEVDRGIGFLQRPGPMVDVRPVETRAVARVEAISLRQEVLERPGRRSRGIAGRPVFAAERRAFVARTLVQDPVAAPHDVDLRAEVRKPVDPACRLHRSLTRGVETEEPDAGLALDRHVRADVQLPEARDTRQRKQPTRAETRDDERRHSDPGAPAVLVERELAGNVRAQRVGVDAPVGEEQIVPGLAHHPRRRREWPRTMLGFLERRTLALRSAEEVGHKFPRSACSLSI